MCFVDRGELCASVRFLTLLMSVYFWLRFVFSKTCYNKMCLIIITVKMGLRFFF